MILAMNRVICLLVSMLSIVVSNAAIALQADMGLSWFNYKINDAPTAVFDIYRDSHGRTWLGTTSGISLFDGFQTYPVKEGDWVFRAQVYSMVEYSGSIFVGSNDGLYILDPETSIIEKAEGDFPREIRTLLLVDDTLWIGSLSGLFLYDISDEAIYDYSSKTPHRAVYSLLESAEGVIYIGTYDGLGVYSRVTGEFSTIAMPPSTSYGGNVFVNAMIENPEDGLIYLGTEGSLIALDVATHASKVLGACNGYSVKSLAFSSENLIAGTDNGLVILNSETDKTTVFWHDSRTPYSIASNVVWCLDVDALGNIWGGTEVGVSIIDPLSPVRIYSLADITGKSAGLQIYKILRDSSGALWMGGSNGLVRFDGEDVVWYRQGTDRPLSHNRVRDLIETSSGEICAATDGGINIYDVSTRSFRNHRIANRDKKLNANWAYSILEDTSDSTIWVAGYLGGIFSEKLDRFRSEGSTHLADTVISTQDSRLPNDLIGQMVADGCGNKWVLHFRDTALTRIGASRGEISRIPFASIVGEEPTMLCVDGAGCIWTGFYGGMVRFKPSGEVCDTIVRFPFGAGNDAIKAMTAVGRDIWIATGTAVFAVDARSMEVKMLSLPSKNYTAIYYDRNTRRAILGASDEVVVVDPIRLSNVHSEEVIDRIRVREGETDGIISFEDNAPAVFRLPYDNRNISIDLGSSVFSPGRYQRFSYTLDREKQWNLLPAGENRITLTSLVSGKHIVRMAVAGSPNSVRTLTIEVASPWYRTPLALTLYAIAIVVIILTVIREVRRRQRRHIEEMERKNVLESVENRLFFLANISHELKTPLSMIIGPLSKIRTGHPDEEVSKDVETAYQNAIKLNTLIHQTVEINRMELRSESMLIYSRIDVVDFCRDIFDNYKQSIADRQFVFTSADQHIYARIDAVKLESLVSNLLSNAVKYSTDGSTVALSITVDDSVFEICVSDDGVGIPTDELSLVFQRLYRSPRTARSHEGTGIGLYLVRQYAQLLGGSITVDSKVNEGSTFRLRLPIGELDEDVSSPVDVQPKASDNRKKVLIVDDNRSIASFISSILSDYNCTIASNGKAGLTVAASFHPDLIIADEMMPVMSGLEMCRHLRSNPALSTVPILLLTAKDSPDILGESINSGVDAYMPKPFEAPVLVAKVAQLINSGENMRRNLRLDSLTEPVAQEAENADERRLAAVTTAIENNLSNPDLNVEFLCAEVGMQQKNLYRLLKKYVGVTPIEYIRQTRLRKAAMLLEQQKFTVSEVMYMVGFSSPSYFSKCFSATFGCTPGQYEKSRGV